MIIEKKTSFVKTYLFFVRGWEAKFAVVWGAIEFFAARILICLILERKGNVVCYSIEECVDLNKVQIDRQHQKGFSM
jgi:hypothetical protein